ncbi:MAG: hypothetical protein QGH83_13330 [Candidatus Pacebacteria bacterium]|jgi:hypothetical protein|nr:hypothetical protein [Candidatus Paceibacterota bacterium]
MSTLKVDTITTISGTGNINLSRPIAGDGSNLTGISPTKTTIEALGIDVPAANLTGTVADARFPVTLPASSGVNLTALNASNISSGTLHADRYTDTVYTHPTTAGNKHIPTAGATDQVLTYSSSGTAAWADPAGGGKVLSYATVNVNTVSSYTMLNIGTGYTNYGLNEAGVDLTPLNISLTPSATSSKILIIATLFLGLPTSTYGVMRLKRGIGTTASLSGSYDFMNDGTSLVGPLCQRGTTGQHVSGNWDSSTEHFTFTDAPATTSAVNYVFNMRVEADAGTTMWLNRNAYGANDYGSFAGVSSVTLLELGI